MPRIDFEHLIDLGRLGRFLDHVKQLISESAGISGATGSQFAQKVIESQADMIYTATSEDGVAYTATVPGLTSLYAGLRIQVKLSRTSASTTPTLNVNGLGAKNIRQPLTTNNAGTTSGSVATWLSSTCPVYLTYNGTMWKTEFTRPSASSLYGSTKIENGGTGADNAEDALANLGAASVEYVDQKIAELRALIDS